jgi:cytochrome c-type biogenesis protein CcmH/NrfG
MPQATGVRSSTAERARMRLPRLTLNTDGQRHPVENVLTFFTLVAGLVACIAGFLSNYAATGAWAHVTATWLGLAVLVVGLYSQLVSATRQERMLIVIGLVAAFVGLCLGLANGGLMP